MLWDSAKVCVLAITIMQNSKKSHAYTYTLVRRCSQLNRLLRLGLRTVIHIQIPLGENVLTKISTKLSIRTFYAGETTFVLLRIISQMFFYCMNWIPLPVAFVYEARLKKLRVLVQTLEIATPCANKKDQSIKTVEVYIV